MPAADSKLVQLRAVLEERFFPILPDLARAGGNTDQAIKNKLSRGLAALATSLAADVDPVTAVRAVIDDYDDNGIDAVYFDRSRCQLILTQAKFKEAGGEPNQAETKKFADGVRDLLDRRYDRFNESFQQMLTDIDDALDQPQLRLLAILAYTGNNLGQHARREISDLLSETNKFTERLFYDDFTLDRFYELLAQEHAQTAVAVSLKLENWYRVETPYRAFYGQVSAADLARLYSTHGRRLFEQNIRHYVGASGVNDAIAETLNNEPDNLFYLNNGLTAVCTRITPKATAQPELGDFSIEGFSIVNGAQTVGSIAASGIDLASCSAKLLIIVIELTSVPQDFERRVTYARNFQNQVRLGDFAALDPLQEKLRRELAISGITYHYKSSFDALRMDDRTFGLEEVAFALACLSGKTDLAVAAKKEAGRLLDRTAPIYSQLFHNGLSATWVCRAVRAFRFLNNILAANEIASSNYNERMFYRHARYFVPHILARKSTALRSSEMELSADDELTLSRELNEFATLVFNEAESFRGPTGYLALARSLTDSTQLAERVTRALDLSLATAASSSLPSSDETSG